MDIKRFLCESKKISARNFKGIYFLTKGTIKNKFLGDSRSFSARNFAWALPKQKETVK